MNEIWISFGNLSYKKLRLKPALDKGLAKLFLRLS